MKEAPGSCRRPAVLLSCLLLLLTSASFCSDSDSDSGASHPTVACESVRVGTGANGSNTTGLRLAQDGAAFTLRSRDKTSGVQADRPEDSPNASGSTSWAKKLRLEWINLAILLAGVLVAWVAYRWQSRPVLSFEIRPGGPDSWGIRPVIHNLTATDAVGLVYFQLRHKNTGQDYDKDRGAYCGKWIWNFPAKMEIFGFTDLGEQVTAMGIEPKDLHMDPLFVEVYLFYRRWYSTNWMLLSRIRSKFAFIYKSPVYKWECPAPGKWIAVPAHEQDWKPPTPEEGIKRLKGRVRMRHS